MRPLTEDALAADLQPLLMLWRQRANGRRFPTWQDITGEDLLPWVEAIHVIEPLPDGDFFFHRFSTISAARLGFDMTGRRLSEIMLSQRAIHSTSTYHRCVTLGRPCCDAVGDGYADGPQHTAYDRLLLPFGQNNERPDMLLAALSFKPK